MHGFSSGIGARTNDALGNEVAFSRRRRADMNCFVRQVHVQRVGVCIGVVGILAHRYQWPWPIVTLGLAVFHAAIAVILFAIARRRFSQVPFRDSTREWDRDRAWLNRHRKRPTPRP